MKEESGDILAHITKEFSDDESSSLNYATPRTSRSSKFQNSDRKEKKRTTLSLSSTRRSIEGETITIRTPSNPTRTRTDPLTRHEGDMREELGRRAGNAEAYRELALQTNGAFKDLVLTLLAPAGGLNIHERTRGLTSSTPADTHAQEKEPKAEEVKQTLHNPPARVLERATPRRPQSQGRNVSMCVAP